MGKYRLKFPVPKSFSCKILYLGLGTGIIPLVIVLLFFGLFSQGLLHELHQSLTELKDREGQRLEHQQHRLIHQQVRQKAQDVAQDLTLYLTTHPGKTWQEIRQDPVFREIAVQPVGMVGETCLVTTQGQLILMHSEKTYEGQPLTKALCLKWKVATPPDLRLAGTSSLQEFSLVQGQGVDAYCQGFLVPLGLKPLQGPELLLGAWVDSEEMHLIIAQPRDIFKTALNVTGALIQTRLDQFRHQLFYGLAALGLLASIASVLLARRLTRQVHSLTESAEAINKGNLGFRIMNPGRDELGQLARTLNRMAASLDENTISRMDWENTFNVLPDPVILVDTEGRLTRLNRAAALYLDVFPEEALGCFVTELRPPSQDWFPDEALSLALKEGQRTRMESCTDNGHTFLVTVDPCRDLKGEISGAVFVARDITALKQMQQELAQATHFLDQLIESAPLGLTFINSQGLIIKANSQFTQEFGYKPEEIQNHHYSFLYIRKEEREQVFKNFGPRGRC